MPETTTPAVDFAVPRQLTQCDQCGQTDDHPKAHVLGPEEADTFHYDCLPWKLRAADEQITARVEARESGLRGEDLLAFIENQTATTSEEI